jgi:hypothetical protein
VSIDYVVAQLFGIAALLFDIVKFTRKQRSHLLIWGIPASWSMITSQYFMGQLQGAAFQSMQSVETILQVFIGNNSPLHNTFRPLIALVFGIAAYFICAPTAYWVTWLPVGIYVFSSIGKAFHNPIKIRIVWLFSSLCTLVYCYFYSNWALVVQQLVIIPISVYYIYSSYYPRKSSETSD